MSSKDAPLISDVGKTGTRTPYLQTLSSHLNLQSRTATDVKLAFMTDPCFLQIYQLYVTDFKTIINNNVKDVPSYFLSI